MLFHSNVVLLTIHPKAQRVKLSTSADTGADPVMEILNRPPSND